MGKSSTPTEAQLRAQAALELRARRDRAELEARYDWYGGPCPCGLEPGSCKVHQRARPEQRPPAGDWLVWVIQAGRSGGKTRAGAEFVRWMVDRGLWREFVIMGATIGDVIKYQVEGPSGLVPISPPWNKARFLPTRSMVEWANGARGYLFTAEEPGALRGGNMNGAWCDEVGKWKYQEKAWNQVEFVVRTPTDPAPQFVVTTTPTRSPVMKRLQKEAKEERERPGSTGVVQVVWHTDRNALFTDPRWLAKRKEQWDGTLYGRQELGGELVAEEAGALWAPEDFEPEWFHLTDPPDDIDYIAVAIDPAAGSEDEKRASEAGIVVGGRRRRKGNAQASHAVVLEDRSCTGKPGDWGRAAVRAYHDWGANAVIAEKNQGGEMVRHVLNTVPAEDGYPSGVNVPVKLVYASVGKTARAGPIQGLYQSGRVTHVRGCQDLEDQMVRFRDGVANQKLDRVDALVWLLKKIVIDFDDVPESDGRIIVGRPRPQFRYIGQRPAS